MADKYWFSSGGFIDIQGISITPNTSARVQALCFYSDGIVLMKSVSIEGEEYNNWANDDDYLIALVGHKLGFGERVEMNDPYNTPKPITPYKFTSGISLAAVPVQDDNRSVHNDNDIQKIQTLESELEAQKTKLNQIMSLLGKNNLI